MKKTLALLLVLATLTCLFAACAQSGTDEPGTSASEQTTEKEHLDDLPEGLDFDQEEVVILSRALQGWTWDEVAVPELNSEPVNDAIFNRNATVSDRLNVKLVPVPIEDADQSLPLLEMERAVLAGSDEYDLVAGACYLVMYTTLQGYHRDLSGLEYLDLDKDYWTQDYNDVISYNGSQYSATGMIALSTYRFAFVTMFNKSVFDDMSVPYLYETVNNGTWTLDYQAELSKSFYQDLNGDGKQDKDDFYGLLTGPGISVDPYWASCNIPLLQKNSDGEYEYVLNVGRLSDATDKIMRLFYESGTYSFTADGMDSEQDDIRIAFANGNGAMATLRLVAVEQADIRNMTDPYGIVPMPKFDTAQKEYGTLQHDQLTVYAVPVTVKDEKFRVLGAVLEAMASESMKTVKPAYYEIALKRKYMSDPVAWDMLDMIFDTVKIDAGIVYTLPLDVLHAHMRDIVASKTNTVSSQYGKMESSVKKKLKTMQEQLDGLE